MDPTWGLPTDATPQIRSLFRFPNQAYNPPAVNPPKTGVHYEEAIRTYRFRIVARARVIRSGTLHRRSRVADPVDPCQTDSHGRLPHQPAQVHQALDRRTEEG